MTRDEMIGLLNGDLRNEWKHLRFYLHHASAVRGLQTHEYKEFFLKEAKGEMGHVTAFSDVIAGLGGEPTAESNDFPRLTDPAAIVRYALAMEEEVVSNYVTRINQAEELGGVDGRWLVIFLEGQVEDSREDVDLFRQIVRGLSPSDIVAGDRSKTGPG